MSDFFGGILDDLSGYADDISSFFDTTIGHATAAGAKVALAKGVKAGYDNDEPTKGSYVGINTAGGQVTKNSAIKSEDFSRSELEWLQRMKRFASLDTGTSVKEGAIS